MKIVFLDRDTIGPGVTIRRPDFEHVWIEHDQTSLDEVVGRLSGAQVAITNKVRITRAMLAELADLRMIAVAATGVDILDLEACRERQIVVSNVRGYATNTVPEHTFALILSLMRNLPQYRAEVLAHRWQQEGKFCFFNRPIRDLAGATLGVIGCGSLGQSVGAIGQAFGMRVLFHDRYVERAPDGTELVGLDELLRQSDVVSCHCPLTPETKGLVGKEQLALMKRSAIIVNTARGGIVDENALADAIEQETVAGAAIDVFEQEPPRLEHRLMRLADRYHVIITPHIAWASVGARQALCDQLTEIIEAYHRGAPINTVT
ncbi:MAG: D-2-hydroxyacid dehydrogenase [Geminicoccales bacterium]